MILTPAVLALFGRQHNVASTAQLRELLSRSQMERAISSGAMSMELPGVRRLAASLETNVSRVMALSLYVGDRGFVSGYAAAREYGVTCVPRMVLEITILGLSLPDLPEWVRVARTSWGVPKDRLILPGGHVVSSPLRTLMRCAAISSDVRFEKIAEQMWNRRLIMPAEAAGYLADVRCSGRNGVARFERWLERAIERPRPSQSALEVDLAAAVTASGLPAPQRQFPLTLRNGERIHLDLAWPNARLAVEPGATWWHSGDEKVRSDARRDRACGEVGWYVMRFDDVELLDLLGCARQVDCVYRERLGSRPIASGQ